MYPRSMFWAKIRKNITIFHLKIIIFKVVKNRSILHGRVFVMKMHVRCMMTKTKTTLKCHWVLNLEPCYHRTLI